MSERRRSMLGRKEPSEPIDYSTRYFTLKALQDGTFKHTNFAVQYSTDDGTTWNTLSSGSSTPTISAGTKVLFKGEITPNNYGVGTFTGTGNFEAEGNVMSLLYGDNFEGQVDLTGKNNAFYQLFSGARTFVKVKNLILPATTLARNCYKQMFANCSSLTGAVELPATALQYGCYCQMFSGTELIPDCSNINFSDPSIASVGGLQGLFGGTKVTDEFLQTILPKDSNNKYYLPLTTLTGACYENMFRGCTSLKTAPKLPATTLASYCYRYMFDGCTSLTTAPELPATTLANGCYSYMFRNCSKLNYVKAMFTTKPSSSYTENWLNGVASTGTFVKNSAATWNVTGVSGVPTKWTVETAVA